jgi:hypothetical protein
VVGISSCQQIRANALLITRPIERPAQSALTSALAE